VREGERERDRARERMSGEERERERWIEGLGEAVGRERSYQVVKQLHEAGNVHRHAPLFRVSGLRLEAQATLKATKGQIDGFFSQLSYKCLQNQVASGED
jgi:hypothetical protein